MRNIDDLAGLRVLLSDGSSGWVRYRVSQFQLTHIIVEVTSGKPATVTAAILHSLHQRYPTQDAVMENMAVSDPTWPGFKAVGYFDAFRHLELKGPA